MTAIGAKIRLDGEQEFRRAVSDASMGLKVLGSELNMVAAQYAANASSAEALTRRGDVLDRQPLNQQEKVDAVRRALENARQTYGETDARTMSWQVSLNNAQTALAKTSTAVDQNKQKLDVATRTVDAHGKAVDRSTTAVSNFGSVASGALSAFGINVDSNMTSALNSMNNFSAGSVLAIGAVVGITAKLVSLTTDTSVWADDILTLSTQTGIAVERLQELQYASSFVDVEVNTMTSSMSRMIRNMQSAAQGTGTAGESFRELGIQVTDSGGKLRDSEKVFFEILDALGRISGETERDALAMTIFGKSARELNPLIEAGSDALRGLSEEARAMGYVMSEETVGKFGPLNDSLERLKGVGTTVSNSLAQALLPLLTMIAEGLSKINPSVLSTIVIVVTVISMIIALVKTIGDLFKSFKNISESMSGFSASGLKTIGIIVAITAALIALGVIIALIISMVKGVDARAEAQKLATGIQGAIPKVDNSMPRYARGVLNHPGGRALVGEEGPEIVDLPAGARVYSARQTRGMMATSGDTFNITISASDVREFTDIVRIAQGARQARRAGKTRGV